MGGNANLVDDARDHGLDAGLVRAALFRGFLTVATAEDVAKVAGIDLTDKEFWRSALQTVAQQIDLVCGLLEEGKQ